MVCCNLIFQKAENSCTLYIVHRFDLHLKPWRSPYVQLRIERFCNNRSYLFHRRPYILEVNLSPILTPSQWFSFEVKIYPSCNGVCYDHHGGSEKRALGKRVNSSVKVPVST